MHTGTNIAMLAGALGAMAGMAMQGAGDPMVQTIGQGWMLAGVASTTLLGGMAALSAKWKSFKAERQMNQTIERLENAVTNGTQTDRTTLNSFINLTRDSSNFFEDASQSKRTAVAERLQILGMAIVAKMPNMEQADLAANVVNLTMGDARFKMGVHIEAPLATRPTMDFASSTPSLG